MHPIVYHGISGQPPGASLSVTLLPRHAYCAWDNPRLASLGIALERQTGVHAIGSDRRNDFDTWLGTTAFTPPGLDVFSESPDGGEYLVLRWDPSNETWPDQRRQRIATPAVLRLAMDLRCALVSAAPAEALEAATQSLAGALDALHAAPLRQPRSDLRALQSLYGPLLKRIEDEIGAPNEDLSLATLSESLHRSPLTFLREFKQLTGLTPHAYINERRLQRARAHCERVEWPLAEIAAASGYASQSHMGVAFRRALQCTPAAYRRLLKRSSGTTR